MASLTLNELTAQVREYLLEEHSTAFKSALDSQEINSMNTCRSSIQLYLAKRKDVPPELRSEDTLEKIFNTLIVYGPLTPYIYSEPKEGISEIAARGPFNISIKQHGRWQYLKDIAFTNDEQFDKVIRKMCAASNVSLSEKNGYTDRVVLSNGARVTIIKHPNTSFSYFLTIRTQNKDLFSREELIKNGSVSPRGDRLIAFLMNARANAVFTGGTDTGKTTTLGTYLTALPKEWHVITIEDVPEFFLSERDPERKLVTPLYTREGESFFTWEKAQFLTMRLAPDIIVFGEIRHSQEGFWAINTMDTGHPGSPLTVHGGTAAEAIERLATFYQEYNPTLNLTMVKERVCKAVDFVVVNSRSRIGRRYIGDIVAIDWDDKDKSPIFKPMLERYYDENDRPQEHFKGIPDFLKTKLLNWHYVFPEDFKEWEV